MGVDGFAADAAWGHFGEASASQPVADARGVVLGWRDGAFGRVGPIHPLTVHIGATQFFEPVEVVSPALSQDSLG